jgi:hypothetical protein
MIRRAVVIVIEVMQKISDRSYRVVAYYPGGKIKAGVLVTCPRDYEICAGDKITEEKEDE